jgi:osmotically inducible protein OsmC
MPTRKAHARWQGTIKEGTGTLDFGNGAFKGAYSFGSRFAQGAGTNPEELLGAAHAGCFAMALSLILGEAGYTPNYIDATAHVTIESQGGNFTITKSHIVCQASVQNIDQATFATHAQTAKANCPVSRALAGTAISLEATLAGG